MEHLKYPAGRFEFGKNYTADDTQGHITAIEQFPDELQLVVSKLSPEQMEKTYRPGGWTARQIIHHLADSHLNAYIRVKLTLTEDTPVIKPYNQDTWAGLEDSKNASPELSLMLVKAVHQRWMYIAKSMTMNDFRKKYFHPEYKREFQLDELHALYAWHGRHHLEHLKIILLS